eukprot:gnl/TRDRNA2_/TRDRNA2_189924_c0_seq1.p1 gnl/TRDRNA2_/TRDRNA2_189924_c0~~gnl/TRDRNA2_/TRDRNA2_189924_c0_seq1.p1  ORF type:complete len:191 (-),score=32.37 gnl/TRDRNA2_/TRDRNA2_189924_c0_seq1:35-607(-)
MLMPLANVVTPPTRFALRARPVFIFLLCMQGLLVFGRFLIMDLWGAMLTMLVVFMGAFAVSSQGGMDATYCLYYGLMCLVNGIFDTILCVERGMHVKYAIFERRAPLIFNVASAIFIMCPVIEIAAAVLSGCIYMNAQEAESRALAPHYAAIASESAALRRDLEEAAAGRPLPQHRDLGYTPYTGQCHKL